MKRTQLLLEAVLAYNKNEMSNTESSVRDILKKNNLLRSMFLKKQFSRKKLKLSGHAQLSRNENLMAYLSDLHLYV